MKPVVTVGFMLSVAVKHPVQITKDAHVIMLIYHVQGFVPVPAVTEFNIHLLKMNKILHF